MAKLLLEGHHILSQEILDGYIFLFRINLFFFFLLNAAILRMGNAAKILCLSPVAENKKSLNSILYFIASSPKLLWTSSSELTNLNYSFNISFKISLKTTKELLLNSMMVYCWKFYCFWIGLIKNRCEDLRLSFQLVFLD